MKTSFLTNKDDSISYIHAKGHDDALHYLITTIGLPTVLVAHTTKDASLDIDWDKFTSGNQSDMAGSIMFSSSKDVHYSFGVSFTRLIEYNDTKDHADMTSYGPYDVAWNSYEFANFTWENMAAESSGPNNMVLFNATRTEDEIWSKNGSLMLKFTAYDHLGRESELPHLQFNENITQFDLTIDNLWTNFSKSRFALEGIMVSEGNTGMKIDETRSIDDEYSPGVFKINNWLSKTGNLDDTGFLQWKPVCYQKSERARSSATAMKHYKFENISMTDTKQGQMNQSILFGYYGYRLLEISKTAMNWSFGIGNDGGYNKTQYLAWSGSIGYGKPPADAISTVVIIIISVGLGLPVVLILLGGIYVCAKKKDPKEKPLRNIQDYQPMPNGQVDS